jgi:hypothetical protein
MPLHEGFHSKIWLALEKSRGFSIIGLSTTGVSTTISVTKPFRARNHPNHHQVFSNDEPTVI